MDLKTYLSSLKPEEREAFVRRCGTSLGYLRNVIGGKQCGPRTAAKIELHSGGDVTRQELRPADYAAIWPELATASTKKAPKARQQRTAA